MTWRNFLLGAVAGTSLIGVASMGLGARPAQAATSVAPATGTGSQDAVPTKTPIKHLVVLFFENVSFDHYFATYPRAANPPGEPAFTAAPHTPKVNNLANANLLKTNPNYSNKANGADAALPFRLDRTQANTADQNHAYTAEEQAYDHGKVDLFPKYTGKGTPGGVGAFGSRGQVMGYFDGNTVGALWRYAQHFAMDDAAYTDTYGPSTPGALELVSGQTNGVDLVKSSKKPSTVAAPTYYVNDGQGGIGLIGDVDPANDPCSSPTDQALMKGRNIGDLLNEAGITWGGFTGGFDLGITNANGTTGCKRSTHSDVVAANVADYIPHHNWFQYYPSTANPTHARPSSVQAIGYGVESDGKTPDPANHDYDEQDFMAAVKAGNFPSVSFIKPRAFQEGHAGYSDPLDEQTEAANVINFLEQQPDWKNTAVIIAWDDSDGWYDHAYKAPSSASYDAAADQLDGPGKCGTGTAPLGLDGKPVNGRCGPGTRIPFLVVSPWSKANFVSHHQISLSSVVGFIEYNWLGGKRLGGGSFDAKAGSILDLFDFKDHGKNGAVYIDPTTGSQLSAAPATSAN